MSTPPRRTPPAPTATPVAAEPGDSPIGDAALGEQPRQGQLSELAAQVGEAVRAAHAHAVPF